MRLILMPLFIFIISCDSFKPIVLPPTNENNESSSIEKIKNNPLSEKSESELISNVSGTLNTINWKTNPNQNPPPISSKTTLDLGKLSYVEELKNGKKEYNPKNTKYLSINNISGILDTVNWVIIPNQKPLPISSRATFDLGEPEERINKNKGGMASPNNPEDYDNKSTIIRPRIHFNVIKTKTTNDKIFPIEISLLSESPIFLNIIYHNNRKVEQILIKKNGNNLTLNATIELREGKNTIQVQSVNAGGVSKSPIHEIIYQPLLRRKQYALLIANEQYNDKAIWQKLPNTIKATKELKRILETEYNFQVKLIQNASIKEIKDAINLYSKISFGEEDELFVYFSGHGDIRINNLGVKIGYLVCSDSKGDDTSKDSYLSHTYFSEIIDYIGCKHILVAIDACHSGTGIFNNDVKNAYTKANPRRKYLEVPLPKTEQINKALEKQSRLYITSGATEVLSGYSNHFSPFTSAILNFLNDENLKKDELIFFEEIRLNLIQKNLNPSPTSGYFGSHELGGNFLFITNN